MRVLSRKEAKDSGALWYFTGRPCTRGHTEMRRTVNGLCKTCERENGRKYDGTASRKKRRLETISVRRKDPNWRSRRQAREAKNPKLQRANLDWRLRKTYGLSVTDYERMASQQAGVCALCGKRNSSGRRLAVDHCHATGAVRSLLCASCNLAIGHLKDDPALMRKAATYVESFR